MDRSTLGYHNNGELAKIGSYNENGKRTGNWKTYHDNGKLESTGDSKNGEQIGEWIYYDKEGNVIKTEMY